MPNILFAINVILRLLQTWTTRLWKLTTYVKSVFLKIFTYYNESNKGVEAMKVEIVTSAQYEEPKVIIYTKEMSEEISKLAKSIVQFISQEPIIGKSTKNKEIHLLNPEEIIRIYASLQKVFVVTEKGEFQVSERLYELEEKLKPFKFIRISKSEIINQTKIKKLDLSIHGTICVYLEGEEKTYVSRRFIKNLKKSLGI